MLRLQSFPTPVLNLDGWLTFGRNEPGIVILDARFEDNIRDPMQWSESRQFP